MDQKHLKIATILLAVILIGYLGYASMIGQTSTSEANSQPRAVGLDLEAKAKREALRNSVLGEFKSSKSSNTTGETTSAVQPNDESLSLRVGVIGSTPQRSELLTITRFPHSSGEIRRLYVDAKARACRLLVAGTAVSPPLSKPRVGSAGTLGRVTVLTLGLEFDRTGPKKLPKITVGQVEKYFAKHRLAVQPELYCDSKHRPYFGTECHAAFYELERPGTTVTPEPMIDVAVGRFRALGVIADQANEGARDANIGRTLALAFTFAKQDDTVTGAADKSRFITEVLLLHLAPESTAEKPEIQVFITSDERRNLHRLETDGMRLNSPAPLINSDIQFRKTVLMGMYPSDPVVSGIHYRSAGILSMDTIKRLSRSQEGKNALGLCEVLDQFGKLASENSLR